MNLELEMQNGGSGEVVHQRDFLGLGTLALESGIAYDLAKEMGSEWVTGPYGAGVGDIGTTVPWFS
jgi:hypothetical protein